MTRACVFLGPSLPLAEAREVLDAIYLPPARRGDVMGAVRAYDPDTVAVIDGYFEQVPSPWHKELLWALDRGIRVAGAASMGALRAAELAQFGMIGAGRIFEAYRDGRFAPFDDPFEDDDEVAVMHGPEGAGYAATEAMVDLRATLAAAEAAGVIDPTARDDVAGVFKALFYKRRTWQTVLDLAAARSPELARWMPANRVRQKRLDARLLLERIAGGLPDAAPPPFRFERTVLWEQAATDGGAGC